MSTSSKTILISPSIIAGDLSTMGKEVETFNPEVIDMLHMDIMDGNFVPNLTFGPGYISNLKKHTDIPLDIHLMIENPEKSLEDYIKIRPEYIVIHYESTRFPARSLKLIRENNIKSGIAINPATPVENIFNIAEYCDMILIMSVDPGFYGQSFMKGSISKIKKLKEFLISENYSNIKIQVDGGVNEDNIKDIITAGADVIVTGSFLFKGGDINSKALNLKKIASS
jgi:ribulose-phosphate 3-epimerase